MNSIEQEHIEIAFPYDSNGKTMEDYFINLSFIIPASEIEDLKREFKEMFSQETNWSF
tara:strand:+ start:437 stop:610 length:174 start_codon:yes stop_codon:yes gene_type:complete